MIHTALLEQRIAQVVETVRAGIVTLADAEFLVELLVLQSQKINELKEEMEAKCEPQR